MTFGSDPDMRDDLRKPFDRKQIGKLPATQKRPALDYVGHAAVTDRLNKAAPDWTYTVDHVFDHGDTLWLRGTMTVGGVSRVEYGDGKDPKEAVGNFIRRAAMRFGVAIDLWAKEELTYSEPSDPPRTAGGSDPGNRSRSPQSGSPQPSGEGEAHTGNQPQGPTEPEGRIAGGSSVFPSTPSPEVPLATPQQWARARSMYGSQTSILRAHHKKFGRSVTAKDVTADELAELIAG